MKYAQIAQTACCFCGGGYKVGNVSDISLSTRGDSGMSASMADAPTSDGDSTSAFQLAPKQASTPYHVPFTYTSPSAAPSLHFNPGSSYNATTLWKLGVEDPTACIDDSNWVDTYFGSDCDTYKAKSVSCAIYGPLQSFAGYSGYDACCGCGGGYN